MRLFVSEEQKWELHGSRPDQFARSVQGQAPLGGLRPPGVRAPERPVAEADHAFTVERDTVEITAKHVVAAVIGLCVLIALIAAIASSSSGSGGSTPERPLNATEYAMQQAVSSFYGDNFNVLRDTCYANGATVTCHVENPYGYKFTLQGTLSADGTIDPQSLL
jgi:hypothetical protein